MGHNGSNVIKNTKTASLVAEGAALEAQIAQDSARLEEIKAALREEARRVADKRQAEDAVEFYSTVGLAQVVFVVNAPSILKDTDPRTVRQRLGDEAWLSLFREKVGLAPGFSGTYAELPAKLQAPVRKVVVWTPSTPRVMLPKPAPPPEK